MKYGLNLPNFGAFGDARTLANLAQAAERAGWDGFFIWDHIARSWAAPVVDPWVALAAIAMNTETIRMGALVTPLPRRRPWKVARETVSIDRLSGGRLIFGVGIGSSGGREVEWDRFGEEMNLKTRGEMLDEGLAILAGLWSGEPFSCVGKHYHVEECQFMPKPIQSPRIPVWVAGYWPNRAPFRRAARWDGMFPIFPSEQEDDLIQFNEVVRYTRERRALNKPYDVVHITAAAPDKDPAKAAAIVARYAEAGATWWLEELIPQHFGRDWQEDWPLHAMHQHILQGPPAY